VGTPTGPTGAGMTTGAGAAGCGGVVWQPASRKAMAGRRAKGATLERIDSMGSRMWLLLVEGGVALFLLVFIVWWTMYLPPKKRDDEDDEQEPSRRD
jgi:hypothetical protein